MDELPFTYLHVFPFSPRDDTPAAELQREMPVPQRVAGERSRDLRERVSRKGAAYRAARAGGEAEVVLEDGGRALTGDYLRVRVEGSIPTPPSRGLFRGRLHAAPDDLYIDLFDPVPAHPASAP